MKNTPRLREDISQEFDRSYAIPTCSAIYEILENANYHILHRPYFGMMGSTHYRITVNPYQKTAVDAARTDLEVISPDDFLALFGEPNSQAETVDIREDKNL